MPSSGVRPAARMSVELVHLDAEANVAIIEVPVVAGKENRAMKAILEYVPALARETNSAALHRCDELLARTGSQLLSRARLLTCPHLQRRRHLVRDAYIRSKFSEASNLSVYEALPRYRASPTHPERKHPVFSESGDVPDNLGRGLPDSMRYRGLSVRTLPGAFVPHFLASPD